MSNLPQSFIYADIQLQTSGHSPAKTQKTMQLSIKTKTKGHKLHETMSSATIIQLATQE